MLRVPSGWSACAAFGALLLAASCGDHDKKPTKHEPAAGAAGAEAGAGDGGSGAPITPEGGAGNVAGQGGSGGAEAGAAGDGNDGGEGPDVRGHFASGWRLRAIWEGAPGARRWLGWFDVELQEVCAFQLAKDGLLRCLPLASAVGFADAECLTPTLPSETGCEVPPFAVERGGACHDEITAYATNRGALLGPFYGQSGDSCLAVSAPLGSEVHSLRKVPLSTFIAALEIEGQSDDQLAISYLEGEDGSLQPSRIFDVQGNYPCEPGASGPYADRCAPAHTALARADLHAYADPECQTLVAIDPSCRPHSLQAVREVTYDDCSEVVVEYKQLGDPLEAHAEMPAGGAQVCGVTSAPFPAYAIGAVIAPSELPQLEIVDHGGGRLKARYFATAAGEMLAFKAFYDSELDLECQSARTALGRRCLPASAPESLYADPECTTMLVRVAKATGTCSERPAPRYAHALDADVRHCTPDEAALRVFETDLAAGPVEAPLTLYCQSQLGCSPCTPDTSGSVLYEAHEVPASDFVELNQRTE